MRARALAFAVLLPACAAQADTTETALITAHPIAQFRIGSPENRFGALTFVGGFSMTADNALFGAVSSLRFEDGSDTRFHAVQDTGYFVSGTLTRSADGVPTGFGPLTLAPLPDRSGSLSESRWETDAESLDIDGDRVTIGYERSHRIAEYRIADGILSAQSRSIPFLIPEWELRSNRGFETIVRAPREGTLAGARIALSEKSIDPQGNIFAAILEGPGRGIFKVARSDEFDITDGAFLPGGDLMILERSYSMGRGVRLRLRRIPGAAIAAGAVVDGTIMLEADMSWQIDNMEGLDIFTAADGSTRLALVSDDNKSILQRNLYLEFTVAE